MKQESRAALALVSPAIAVIALVAIAPMVWTLWESLHLHDLRMPWLGQPFVGLDNYAAALGDARFRGALLHTGGFVLASVSLELALGLVFALAMSRARRGRALIRVVVLLSWAVPTVVAALVWRFMFEGDSGIVPAALRAAGAIPPGFSFFVDPLAAWIPIVVADAWKMTPFVALLLLAGLESIEPALYDAARMDGAGPWRQFREITLPLLRPALLVAILFRALDAFRVFDVIYVLTGGGPGTSTEPIALYIFNTLLQHLRFGYGSALSVIVFLGTFVLALAYIRLLGRSLLEERTA
ncbi:MAG TPA: sugar ABC transporter permease [Thermoanaerobaculia bacterium]|nr:sugar ABC transporter permease [Thermoanaerobaculia bacterium]